MKQGVGEAVTVGSGGRAGETDVDTPVRGQATEERIVLPGGAVSLGDEAVSPSASAASRGRGRTFVRVALLGLVGVALAGFWFVGGSDLLTLDRLRASHDTLVSIYRESPVASVLVFSLVYVAATALSFPGAAVLTLGGASVFGFWVSLVAISFASTVGATLAFMGARYVFRDWVARRFMEPMRRVDEGVRKDGLFYLFSLRLVPVVPFFLVNLLMGLTRMPTRTYYWVSQVGMLPGTAVYVYAGQELGRIRTTADIFSPGLVAAFVLLAVFPWMTRSALAWYRGRRMD
jgi:uncharacterized membrane protein YdjX (TVP38/TMEM64 family)